MHQEAKLRPLAGFWMGRWMRLPASRKTLHSRLPLRLVVQGDAEDRHVQVLLEALVDGRDDGIEVEARGDAPAELGDRYDLAVRLLELRGLLLELVVAEAVDLGLLAALLDLVLDGDVLDLAARVLGEDLPFVARVPAVVVQGPCGNPSWSRRPRRAARRPGG